jgi:HEAT repeat protein
MSAPEEAPQKPAIDDKPLPPIEPPSAGFILQLFVIPMMIVTIIVLVWLMFSWIAHMGSNPRELVQDLTKADESSWQKALTLADLLRHPEHQDLKRDVALAMELAKVLETQIDDQHFDENSIRLRMFVCRALGEFEVPQALPAIVRAATVERDAAEIDVRRTALEALAAFATNNGSDKLVLDEACMDALKQASRERTEVDAEKQARANLRSTAAFVLGVIGGEQALDRLVILLDDPYANARYNAATGLCRHGDLRAIPVLLEMLDPDNPEAAREEEFDSGKAFKRLMVIDNGIRGALQLAADNSRQDLKPVADALQAIIDSDLQSFGARARWGLRSAAQEALLAMQASERESTSK